MKRTLIALTVAVCLSAAVASASAQTVVNQATISFNRPTTLADGSPLAATADVTYAVYQGLKGQAKVKVATVGTVSSVVNAGLLGGNTYCWQVTAIAAGAESALSNEACKTFAVTPPSAVVIVVQ